MCEPERATRVWEETRSQFSPPVESWRRRKRTWERSQRYKKKAKDQDRKESVMFQVTCQSQDPVFQQTHTDQDQLWRDSELNSLQQDEISLFRMLTSVKLQLCLLLSLTLLAQLWSEGASLCSVLKDISGYCVTEQDKDSLRAQSWKGWGNWADRALVQLCG